MSAGTEQIDSAIDVVTPENISFRYQLAGPFHRFPAFVIDLLVRFAIWIGMLLVIIATGLFGSGVAALGATLWLLIWFVLEWFYGGLLETFWNGQTVGKRLLGLRVLRTDGQPINGLQAVMRNLLRLVDMMPLIPASIWFGEGQSWAIPTCLFGLLVPMLWGNRYQRLGDLACGTMVVVEKRHWKVTAVTMDDPAVRRLAAELPANYQVGHKLSQALASYIERRRYLSPARRTEIARHLAEPLSARLGIDDETNDDRLLCALYYRTFVSDVLAERRGQWQELDRLSLQLERTRRRRLPGATASRFASLYRSACADLALSDTYHLPQNTIQYLHQLVGRAHNQLYRSRTFDYGSWGRILWVDVPRRIIRDGCVQLAFVLFWGFFLISAALAASPETWPEFAGHVVGDATLAQLEENFAEPITGRQAANNPLMASFYIYHNTGIGLRCFAGGLLVLPGLLITIFNALSLGTQFGYMTRPDVAAGANFFQFVTAHGPFELTAIVLSAGAGLRLGLAWLKTNGLTRVDSLRRTTSDSMPLMGMAMLLFFAAALIEAFVSPSSAPYAAKAAVATLCTGLLLFYFVVLGYPRGESRAV